MLLDELDWWDHKFPCEGGYLDQPYTLMQDLRMVRLAIEHQKNSQSKASSYDDQLQALKKQALAQAGVR